MVIIKEDYFKIRLPYYKISVVWFLSLLFFIFSLLLLSIFYQSNNILILILFFLSFAIFLSLKSLLPIIGSILENLGLFLFESFILLSIIYFSFKIFNLYFIVYFLLAFYIFNILLTWSIIQYYNNQPKLNFIKLFLISWNYYIYIVLVILFLAIFFFFNISSLSKDKIVNFIGNLNYVFEILNLGVTPDMTFESILSRNLPAGIDEATKKDMIDLALSEFNNKFQLKLKPETKLKEAIADFILLKIQDLNTNGSTFLLFKVIFSIFLLLILKYLFTFMGYLLSPIALIIFVLLKSIGFIKIEYEKIDKEIIKI